jgi:ribonuclease P protein component
VSITGSTRPESQTLSWKERLHKRRDFLRIYNQGKRIFTATLVAYVLGNRLDRPRLGVTVSRKIGKAATRNRIKRRIRELFRTSKNPGTRGFDIVVNVRKAAARAPFATLRDDYFRVLRRIGGKTGRS